MKKYRVYGTTVVTVIKEVWANDKYEAQRKADNTLSCLTAYCGNGGIDKLIGVAGYDESVSADEYIEWNDTEELEDDPDYFECPDCGEACDLMEEGVWWCDDCEKYFNEDSDEIDYEEDEEEDEEDED